MHISYNKPIQQENLPSDIQSVFKKQFDLKIKAKVKEGYYDFYTPYKVLLEITNFDSHPVCGEFYIAETSFFTQAKTIIKCDKTSSIQDGQTKKIYLDIEPKKQTHFSEVAKFIDVVLTDDRKSRFMFQIELRTDIYLNALQTDARKFKDLNVLVLGPAGAGKSTLILLIGNALSNQLEYDYFIKTCPGTQHCTETYNKVNLRANFNVDITFHDTIGVTETGSYSDVFLDHLADNRIPEGHRDTVSTAASGAAIKPVSSIVLVVKHDVCDEPKTTTVNALCKKLIQVAAKLREKSMYKFVLQVLILLLLIVVNCNTYFSHC